MRIKEFLILTLLTLSCSGTKNLTELSELTIQNRSANELIIDRKPEYGDGQRDGCVFMEEISMNITELNNGKSIRGKVFDSKTKEPLINAKLKLFIEQNGSSKTLEIKTNENGFYNSDFKGKLKKIEVEYIAHRTLKVDLEKT
ncbi:hypothetical protein [Aestuariibaculum lutulentum]|uniref:Carboxypeptidase regulatory-like domain-containing protein n=1 Tax=Aestuariibaculum lutulentum TaxID=2920935 RepID=A0ABS9RMF6_9FLAO|nr:hypothetical protein [Aestuariibaculum lutulentum]MCH4554138.1 hypothetical protein [Aestuariibaculum lutulentum]